MNYHLILIMENVRCSITSQLSSYLMTSNLRGDKMKRLGNISVTWIWEGCILLSLMAYVILFNSTKHVFKVFTIVEHQEKNETVQ